MSRAIDEEPLETSRTDRLLDSHRDGALNYRQLAYELLKDTRNVDYVHARYSGLPGLEGLTKENLQNALDVYEKQLESGIEKPRFVHALTERRQGNAATGAGSEIVPEALRGETMVAREPGEGREPGEDDEPGE